MTSGEVRRGINPHAMSPVLKNILGATTVISVLFVVILLWSDRGLGELRRLDQQTMERAGEIEQLQAENDRLGSELGDPSRRSRRIERIAREELGLVSSDEVVLLLPTNSPLPPADRTTRPQLSGR